MSLVDFGIKRPTFFSCCGIERDHTIEGRGEVEHSVDKNRSGLKPTSFSAVMSVGDVAGGIEHTFATRLFEEMTGAYVDPPLCGQTIKGLVRAVTSSETRAHLRGRELSRHDGVHKGKVAARRPGS
jgi:hypothetical protein